MGHFGDHICPSKCSLNNPIKIERSSRKAWLFIKTFAIHSPFLLPLFIGGKRKGEENNQSHGQKSCLSARSDWKFDVNQVYCIKLLFF